MIVMNDNQHQFGGTNELSKRDSELEDFLVRMFDVNDRPYFVADEACIYDFYAGDVDEFSMRCFEEYGRKLVQADFRLPIWKLLDLLNPPQPE